MSRATKGSFAAFVVVLAIAAPAVPQYVLPHRGIVSAAPFAWLSEAALMALLGAGLIVLGSSVRRRGNARR
jgi:hypothetical protein